jgi:hypothetical protein
VRLVKLIMLNIVVSKKGSLQTSNFNQYAQNLIYFLIIKNAF